MQKRVLNTDPSEVVNPDVAWLPLDLIASVEVTSEDASQPIENALLDGAQTGWRAAQPGEQTIRLIFNSPQHLRHIRLMFIERDVERSQEFVLRWSGDGGRTLHEIVRQQWNFNPNGSSQQSEDYQVDLRGVTQLELVIVPDRSKGLAFASLEQLRLGIAVQHSS
jgi:hypothetical protein